ncbi:beta-lactamase [Actinobacteria bacterium OK074]|nr:beta-lactamase [Actinobacteria bacterium OK074]
MGVNVSGMVAEGFEPVRDAFAANFATRGERGAAVAVYRHGEKVVDLWGGTKDVDGTAPWESGTAQIVRSATKGVAAAVLLMLAERGELDLDAPVGRYWPEFKARGKERALVRHVLAHRVGVPALDRPLTVAEAADPDFAASVVAAQAPAWEPGTDHGYHAQTYSWLTGELVRRVTGGVSIGAFIASEIARPLGLDLWVGLPAEAADRVGRVGHLPPPPPASASGALRVRPRRAVADAYADPDSLTRRAFAAISPAPDENDAAYRAAVLPASNGVATAGALARFYAALLGEVGGVRLWERAETLGCARAEESAGADRVLVVGTRFGLGYMLHGAASPFLSPGSFGHPGRGGALGFADPESGIAFGYVTNGFRSSVTADARAQGVVGALGGVWGGWGGFWVRVGGGCCCVVGCGWVGVARAVPRAPKDGRWRLLLWFECGSVEAWLWAVWSSDNFGATGTRTLVGARGCIRYAAPPRGRDQPPPARTPNPPHPCSINPTPTTTNPAPATLATPNRSLKNTAPIPAPTMIDDSRSAATGASSALVWAHSTKPYASTDSAAPRNPSAANGRTTARVRPRQRYTAYTGNTTPWHAINHAMYPSAVPESRTPRPSTTVYAAIVRPVANAATIAGQLGRRPRRPHSATPVRPTHDTATPANAQPSGTSWANTAARTVTTSGAVPRAMGYAWPKSPRRKDRISSA